jgi:23S rRNA pseudouridine2605 synthase
VANDIEMSETGGRERIAKRLSRAGVCSRREAERWIADGRIVVDGHKISEPGTLVDDSSDIRVDGKPIAAPQATRLWRYHKPAGLICSNNDPQGRPTIFDKLPKHLPRVMTVGRLDYDSEGLLLLTNDGGLARKLELPATGWVRRYRIRVYKTPTEDDFAKLAKGLTVDGVTYGPVEASVDSAKGANAWLTVALQEGKNREIRRLFDHLGYPVNRLIRIAYGPFQLGKMPRGAVEEVPGRVLRDQLGAKGGAGRQKNANRRGHA